MVDAVEGVIGIDWIDGKSVRALLGGGEESEPEEAEGKDEDLANDDDVGIESDDPLAEFGLAQSMLRFHRQVQIIDYTLSSQYHGNDWDRDSENALRAHHPWRSDDVEHDAATKSSLIHPVLDVKPRPTTNRLGACNSIDCDLHRCDLMALTCSF